MPRREQPPRNEKQLQNRIWKEVIRLWPNAWLFHPVGGPYQLPGIPDLLMVVNGVFIGMEIKFPGPRESVEHARARATPQQRRQIRFINIAGGMAGVVTSVPEAMDLIRRAFVKRDILQQQREKESE
jgi:hypothetical protein